MHDAMHSSSRLVHAFGLSIAVLLAACSSDKKEPPPKGESLAEAVDAFGADASKRMAALKKIKAALAAAKPDGKIPGDLKFVLDGMNVKADQNAALLYDDELEGDMSKRHATLWTTGPLAYPPRKESAVSTCRHLVTLIDKKDASYATNVVDWQSKAWYEACAKLKYAVVIRVTKDQKAVVGAKDEATGVTKFETGKLEADLLVFELPEAKLVGGVAGIAAENSENLTADKFTSGSFLEDDLRYQFYKAVKEKLAAVPETKEKH